MSDELSYRELVQSANTIVLRWDLEGRITFLNDYGLEFFGFKLDELVGRSVVGTIVPETETSGRDLGQMIAELLRHPDRYVNNENENVRRDGERVWVTWRNRVLHDVSGRTRELLSIGIDTTDRKRAEEALRNSERRYRALFQSMPIALVERDATGLEARMRELREAGVADIEVHLQEHPEELARCLRLVVVTDVNAAALALLEIDDKAAFDTFAHVTQAEGFARMVRSVAANVATGTLASQETEGVLRTRRGGQRNVLARTTVVPALPRDLHDKGVATGAPPASARTRILTALVDITERKLAEEALRASEERFRFLAEHDNLTGLYNRRYLYQVLEGLMHPEHAPCSVVFIDLDRFKHVVDTHGHLNGSRVIQEVAEVLRAQLKPPGFAVAYAGDEFVVVLPGKVKAEAIETARVVGSAIGVHTFLAELESPVRLTASLGVATYPEDAEVMEDLLGAADRALFDAKESGRNVVAAARRRV